MIYLCVEPSLSYPLFSDALAVELTKLGHESLFVRIGEKRVESLARQFFSFSRRLAHDIPAYLTTNLMSRSFLRKLQRGDVVIVYESFGLVSGWSDGWFHREVKRKGAKLVSLMQDAWPTVNCPAHRKACALRLSTADMVGAVTPNLKDLLQNFAPRTKVVLMEEAVNVDLFSPNFFINEPVVIWSGPPSKQSEIAGLVPVLESVYEKRRFRLRIASGVSRPKITTSIPIDWISFIDSYTDQFRGASIAFACYKDTAYDRCKGNYKIKTYLAAGCAIVSNPVGYNHELIRPGINGLFANTPEEWEAAFLRLLKNPDERLAMRKASRELAVKRFSYEAIAQQYAGVLSSLRV